MRDPRFTCGSPRRGYRSAVLGLTPIHPAHSGNGDSRASRLVILLRRSSLEFGI
jgi:hypothetical protein